MAAKMNKEEFIDTGRITTLISFLNSFLKEPLHEDCTDVVCYKGGHYIQLLESGEFLYKGFKDTVLDNVEDFMCKENNIK